MRKYILWLVIFAIIEISLALYLTFWREHFWQAISHKQQLQFLQQLGIFTAVALCICFVSGISGYLVSLASIKWREKLNNKASSITCSNCNGTGHDIENPSSWMCYSCDGTGKRIRDSKIENLNQRIQQDCWDYPTLVLTLGFGLIKSISYIVVFCAALILSFSWMYLTILIIYSIIGTLVGKYIAKPLISLNYQQQRVEATYRNDLTINKFEDCIRLMLGLAKKQKHLTYFQQFYSQVGVIIPMIIIAPEYFQSSMTLGMLMRFNSTGGTILDNMSFGIASFGDINKLLSCRKRLKEANIL